MSFSRAILQNGVQVSLSTSFLMFIDVESLLDQPIIVSSCILSLLSMVKKTVELWKFAHRDCRRDPKGGCGCASFASIFALLILSLAAWNGAKLVFIETCPYHAWRISSGCT